MSPANTIAPAIMDTVLGHLALLFLTGAHGDLASARRAAAQMLAAYNVETPDELRLAAEVISFGFHALEALSQAAAPDFALTKILRLRGSAVSLSREGHKAQRKLDRLQRDRRAEAAAEQPAPPAKATPAAPQADEALDLVEFARHAMAAAGQAAPLVEATPVPPQANAALDLMEFARHAMAAATSHCGQNWTKSFQQREAAKRIAANLKKNQAAHAASLVPAVAES